MGLCLGMQLAVVEFARNVIGWQDANSTEFNPATTHPVIDLLPDQKDLAKMGGTMRLGEGTSVNWSPVRRLSGPTSRK